MDNSNASLTKFRNLSRPSLAISTLRILILGSFAAHAHAQSALDFHHPIPGGSVALILGSTDTPRPVTKFGGRRVLVTRHQDHWVALLGLSLDTVPGRYIASVSNNDEPEIRDFVVKPHRYPVRRVVEQTRRRETSTNPAQPGLADLYEKLLPMTSLWSEGVDVDLPLRAPVDGRQINEYGSRQVKGDDLTKPVDFAEFETGANAQARSPGRGRVHELIVFDDAGVIVCIDHGMGLLSFIGPLPSVRVNVGDRLAKNQVLGVLPQGGAAPSTVRWLVSLNQAFINPMLLVDRP